ncbi:MAG TPA: non-homologous end-joining DNA ligase [Blastocatellia bacterium]|nr:non-homologous end-joining DNA ligase [Blastocatellia bacterium]
MDSGGPGWDEFAIGWSEMGLKSYHDKRDFDRTPEPKGRVSKEEKRRFVVQEHHASKLHFDFRLEMGGVLKSWSVPKGPSLDPGEKRLAVPTEDHPVEYLSFEGVIPEGSYGAGQHIIWDSGSYEPVDGDPLDQLEAGRLSFMLEGRKLRGRFNMVRLGQAGDRWLLIKSDDKFADPDWELELILKDESGPAKNKPQTRPRRAEDRSVKRYAVKAKQGERKPIPASQVFKSKELAGNIDLKVGRDIVTVTNLDKVYWPRDSYTKGDLIRYYYQVSKYILPYLKDRPLIMKRYPNGIRGGSFHQHDVDEAPDYVRTASIEVAEGHTVDYIVNDNTATLLYVANLGAIERHPWHSRLASMDRPDWFVFDLDPGNRVDYSTICEVALILRRVLGNLGFDCCAKTSGSRGMHVYVPIRAAYGYEEVSRLAEAVATLVARESPDIATVERSLKKRRRDQVYVDHLQNAQGKSVVAPYSVRPRDGATVSAPLDWAEVKRKKVRPQDFTIKNIIRRIERKGDLFRLALKKKQTLGSAIERVEAMLEKKARRARA